MAHQVDASEFAAPLLWMAIAVCAVWGPGCSDEGTTEPGTRYRTAPIEDDFSHIPDPRTRWENYGVRDYLIDVDVLCLCDENAMYTLVVQGGEIIDLLDIDGHTIASGEDLASYRTIDESFDWVLNLIELDPYFLRIEYDERFGFPSVVYTDFSEAVADDEREETRTGIRRLVGIE